MINLSQLQSTLAAHLQASMTHARIQRGNELHFQVARGDVLRLAEILRRDFKTELVLMVANDRRADKGVFEVHYLFANDAENWFVHATKELPADDPRLHSMATFYFPAARLERELDYTFGIEAIGYPSPTRLVRRSSWPEAFYPLRKDAVTPEGFQGKETTFDFIPIEEENTLYPFLPVEEEETPYPFLPVEGEGVYEIPVGPVHAGIIEPGHFRFSVVGETVINLQMRLFFTHKGVEKLFEGRTPDEGLELAERISGDTTIGHALAYCQALESLVGCEIPDRAKYLRVVLLEMERLYNHIADFGAICNDTGFAVAHSHCFRIRERLLRLNKRLTGNRLLRGGILPGGVGHDLPLDLNLAIELDSILADFNEIVEISLGNSMLMDRLEGTGRLTLKTATDHGVVGYVARASGIDVDVRRDHPFAAYPELNFRVPVFETGDVIARTMARVEEARESVNLILQALARLPNGPISQSIGQLPAWEPAFGMVEGWRGAIIHWIMADNQGKLYRVKVKDPSFVNWPALPFAMLKNIVPDFPLCNKSFNQSYSGNDL
ncbi:MAG TPA: NADH-quinone oxidoreductase subunit C [Aggregatilineaceae bacterium]|nr:NADH-quinone oxidoreductase subunit C [Aggregatilineaceae bacterium]